MAFYAQGKSFQALQQDKSVEWTDGGTCVAQQNSPDTGSVSCGNLPEATQSNLPESTMTPPNDEPCPPMNFVAECTTISAPCSIGRIKYGVPNVLSIIKGILWRWAISATAYINDI